MKKKRLSAQKAVELENATPEEIIAFAVETFPNITFACSFGAEDVVLVDMLQKISPKTDIFYLDTDFHFKETYETRDRMAERYPGIPFVEVKPEITPEEQARNLAKSCGNPMRTHAATSAK